MNADQFHVRLLGLRGIARELMASDIDDDQRCSLGAEFHDLAETILDHFRATGKFYRKRED